MMMPANFSAIAENELTYVVGGSAVTDFAKTLNTNIVTIIGNSYVGDLIGVTLGTMFSGSWGESGTPSLTDAMSTAFFKTAAGKDQNGFNKVLSAIGIGAAVYQLGATSASSIVSDSGKTKKVEYTDPIGDTHKKKFAKIWTTIGLVPSNTLA